MFNSLPSAFDMLPAVISVSVACFALDVWQRLADAARAARGRSGAAGAVLAVWAGVTLIATHTTLGAVVAFTPGLQPALLLGAIMAAVALAWPARSLPASTPLESMLSLFYWRAVFGALIIAGYAADRLPAGFAVSAGLGDMAVTMLMIVVLALRTPAGDISRRPLWAWNVLGLADLLIAVPVLGALVLRPWAQQRGLTGHFALQLFVVPVFIGLHVHLFARLWREGRSLPVREPAGDGMAGKVI